MIETNRGRASGELKELGHVCNEEMDDHTHTHTQNPDFIDDMDVQTTKTQKPYRTATTPTPWLTYRDQSDSGQRDQRKEHQRMEAF